MGTTLTACDDETASSTTPTVGASGTTASPGGINAGMPTAPTDRGGALTEPAPAGSPMPINAGQVAQAGQTTADSGGDIAGHKQQGGASGHSVDGLTVPMAGAGGRQQGGQSSGSGMTAMGGHMGGQMNTGGQGGHDTGGHSGGAPLAGANESTGGQLGDDTGGAHVAAGLAVGGAGGQGIGGQVVGGLQMVGGAEELGGMRVEPEPCVVGTAIGLCTVCGIDNQPTAAERDPACIADIECPDIRYENGMQGEQETCSEVRSVHSGRCIDIGICEPANAGCEEIATLVAIDNECADIIRCSAEAPPQLTIETLGTPCGGAHRRCAETVDGVMTCLDWHAATHQMTRGRGFRGCGYRQETGSFGETRRFQLVFANNQMMPTTCDAVCGSVDASWQCVDIARNEQPGCPNNNQAVPQGANIGCSAMGLNLFCQCKVN